MVHIGQKVNPLLGGDNFHVIERTKSQVERLDKLPFVLFEIRLAILTLHNFDSLIQVNGLNDVRTRTSKMSPHLRMRLNDGLHGFCEQ